MVTCVSPGYPLATMFEWGETDMLWAEGMTALFRWRRERKALAVATARLIAETEKYLASRDPRRATEPPA